jgi:hypothetical protein
MREHEFVADLGGAAERRHSGFSPGRACRGGLHAG